MARLFVAPFLLLLLSHTPARTKFANIHQVDFKNFTYPWDESYSLPSTWAWMPLPLAGHFRLVRGRRWLLDPGAEPEERGFTLLFAFESVAYGSIGSDRSDVAAVYISYSTGGTATWGYLYVYRLAHGEPMLMGSLVTGSRAYGGLVKAAFQNGLLVLDFEDPSKREGDCCSDGYIRVSYRWQNGRFVEVPPRQYGPLK